MFSLIVAYDQNRLIGKENGLPWHLKGDLKLFKEKTIYHRIVMGKNTFMGLKAPLKDRVTIVVSRSPVEENESVVYCKDFEQFLKDNQNTEEEILICGGASIYKKALPYCQNLYISHVDGSHDGDTYFPEWDSNEFTVVEEREMEGFTFRHYRKKEA